jgi:hypothetical protein
MIGVIFSEVLLFGAAVLLGFAVGWRLYTAIGAQRRVAEERDIERLRAALTEAQVRRARGS